MIDPIEMCSALEKRLSDYVFVQPSAHPYVDYWDEVSYDEALKLSEDYHNNVIIHTSDPIYDPKTHTYSPSYYCVYERSMDMYTGEEADYGRWNYACPEYTIHMPSDPSDEKHDFVTAFRTDFLDDLHVLLIVEGYVDPLSIKVHEPNFWQLGHIMACDEDKNIYSYEPENRRAVYYPDISSTTSSLPVFRTALFSNLYFSQNLKNLDNAVKTLDLSLAGKLYPEIYYPKLGQAERVYDTFTHLIDYLTVPVSKTKTSKMLQALLDKPLPDLPDFGNVRDPLVIQKVEDGLCAVRLFQKDWSGVVSESCRIYISKDKVTPCAQSGDHWVRKNLKTCGRNWRRTILSFDKDDVKDTKLEYVADLLTTIPKGELLWGILRDPLIEQLAKLGLGNTLATCCGHYAHLEENLRSNFGQYLDSGTPSHRLGLNNYQLKAFIDIMNTDSNKSSIIKDFKTIFAKQFTVNTPDIPFIDISSIDNQSFDEVLSFVAMPNHYNGTDLMIATLIEEMYGTPRLVKMCPKLRNLTLLENYSTVSAYRDYLHMNAGLHREGYPLLSCDFDEMDAEHSITEMHDAVTALYNLKKNEAEAKKFKDANARAQKWVYQTEDFMIKAPESAQDLINEGINLHHCVGSYVDRVCNNRTNILFLRRRDYPDNSYFTIEVTNDNTIQQIHGMCNQNLIPGCPEEAFVQKWAKAKKLTIGHYDQVR